MRCLGLLLSLSLLWVLLIPGGNVARARMGESEETVALGGSFRSIGGLTQNFENLALFEKKKDAYLQSLLRLTGEGHSTDRISCEVHLVSAFTYTSGGDREGGFGFGPDRVKTRYRAVDLSGDFMDHQENRSGTLWLDRLNCKVALPKADVTIGRQAITFGKAYFWNPLDLFLPFDPAQFDRDYKPGVDGLRIDIPLGLFSGLTVVSVLGRKLNLRNQYEDNRTAGASWFGSSVLVRGFTHYEGWDVSLQAGKVYGGWHVGGGLVGEIDSIQLRLEAARFWADEGPVFPGPDQVPLLDDNLTAVIGMGRHWPSSLDIQVECLFNGGGESDAITLGMQRAERGAVLHAGRVLAGVTVSYEVTPLVLGQLAVLQSQTDGSTQVQPTLRWSTSDNTELLLGASLNRGDRPTIGPQGTIEFKSEFGSYPHYFFAEFKGYF
jgi:hypothetical protein